MQTTEQNKPAEAQSFLTDELANMKRDAERYRYLRSGEMRQQSDGIHPADGSVWVVKYNHQRGSIPELNSAGIGAELDAAIDAAMAPNAPHEGADAALSRTLPLDAVVGRQNVTTE